MSRASTPPLPVSRPTWLDYLLILVGVSLSLYLYEIHKPVPQPKSDTPEWVRTELFPLLPLLLALPQGILLLWPFFYATAKLHGRPQALSAGEWLWGVAWLGTLLLTGWNLWIHWGTLPEFATDLAYPPQSIWTIIVLPVMAALALVIGLLSLFSRWNPPWTHTFGLILLIWPIIPLGGLLLWAEPGWKWVS